MTKSPWYWIIESTQETISNLRNLIEDSKARISKSKNPEFVEAWSKFLEFERIRLNEEVKFLEGILGSQDAWLKENQWPPKSPEPSPEDIRVPVKPFIGCGAGLGMFYDEN